MFQVKRFEQPVMKTPEELLVFLYNFCLDHYGYELFTKFQLYGKLEELNVTNIVKLKNDHRMIIRYNNSDYVLGYLLREMITHKFAVRTTNPSKRLENSDVNAYYYYKVKPLADLL